MTSKKLFVVNCFGGEWRIRTSEGVHQQIYSLIHLATLETPQKHAQRTISTPYLSLELQNYAVFVRCQQGGQKILYDLTKEAPIVVIGASSLTTRRVAHQQTLIWLYQNLADVPQGHGHPGNCYSGCI